MVAGGGAVSENHVSLAWGKRRDWLGGQTVLEHGELGDEKKHLAWPTRVIHINPGEGRDAFLAHLAKCWPRCLRGPAALAAT